MINTAVKDMAEVLAAGAAEGRSARAIGNKAIAFSKQEGLVPIVAAVVETAQIDGLTFDGVRVEPSATPAAKVAEGAPKPLAATLQDFTTTLPKYSAVAEFSLERALSTDALVTALQATLVGQSLVAYDRDCVAALVADAGLDATGATWSSAILNGIAAVASSGGAPSLLVLSPADYAAAIEDPGQGFSTDPSNGISTLFGLRIALSVGATTGQSFVMDERAAVAVENVSSPLALLDCYSKADTNIARLVTDLVASFVVTQPNGVCAISVTPTP